MTSSHSVDQFTGKMEALQQSVDAMMRCDKTLCFLSFHLRNLQKISETPEVSHDPKLPAVIAHFTRLRNEVELKKLDHVNLSLKLFGDVSSDLKFVAQFDEQQIINLSNIAAYCEQSLQDLSARTTALLDSPDLVNIENEIAPSSGLLPDFCTTTDPQLLEEMDVGLSFNTMIQGTAHQSDRSKNGLAILSLAQINLSAMYNQNQGQNCPFLSQFARCRTSTGTNLIFVCNEKDQSVGSMETKGSHTGQLSTLASGAIFL